MIFDISFDASLNSSSVLDINNTFVLQFEIKLPTYFATEFKTSLIKNYYIQHASRFQVSYHDTDEYCVFVKNIPSKNFWPTVFSMIFLAKKILRKRFPTDIINCASCGSIFDHNPACYNCGCKIYRENNFNIENSINKIFKDLTGI